MSIQMQIDETVRSAFPRHGAALLHVTAGMGVRPIRGATRMLANQFDKNPAPAIRATEYWRGVFATMEAKPKYGSSVEKLHRMHQASGGSLAIPLELVELYCWFSLVHGVPMAGYRPARIAGMLRLSMPGPGVPFVALGQSRGSQERTRPREVAYVDDEKAICRYWNYRDCDETKLVDGVADAVFVFDLVNEPGLCGTDAGRDLTARFASLLEGEPRSETAVVTSAHHTAAWVETPRRPRRPG
jgi:DNA/RNA-binding domain of Phe-tRNA-synthetase-like protein